MIAYRKRFVKRNVLKKETLWLRGQPGCYGRRFFILDTWLFPLAALEMYSDATRVLLTDIFIILRKLYRKEEGRRVLIYSGKQFLFDLFSDGGQFLQA